MFLMGQGGNTSPGPLRFSHRRLLRRLPSSKSEDILRDIYAESNPTDFLLQVRSIVTFHRKGVEAPVDAQEDPAQSVLDDHAPDAVLEGSPMEGTQCGVVVLRLVVEFVGDEEDVVRGPWVLQTLQDLVGFRIARGDLVEQTKDVQGSRSKGGVAGRVGREVRGEVLDPAKLCIRGGESRLGGHHARARRVGGRCSERQPGRIGVLGNLIGGGHRASHV